MMTCSSYVRKYSQHKTAKVHSTCGNQWLHKLQLCQHKLRILRRVHHHFLRVDINDRTGRSSTDTKAQLLANLVELRLRSVRSGIKNLYSENRCIPGTAAGTNIGVFGQ